MTQNKIAIYSDHHADMPRLKRMFNQKHPITIDLGDFELPYIGRNHSLRQDQQDAELTIDAIVRNAKSGDLSNTAIEIVNHLKEYFSSLESVDFLSGGKRRMLKGNALESWTNIVRGLSGEEKSRQLVNSIDKLHNVTNIVNDVGVEGIGILDKNYSPYCSPSTGARVFEWSNGPMTFIQGYVPNRYIPSALLIYLPWKGSIESARKISQHLEVCDYVSQLAILSHDYFGPGTLPEGIPERKWEHEEQVTHIFDYLRKRKFNRVDAYFGHIDKELGPFTHTRVIGNNKINFHHVDEKDGNPVYLTIGEQQ